MKCVNVAATVYNAAAICCLSLFVNVAYYVLVTVCNVAVYKVATAMV